MKIYAVVQLIPFYDTIGHERNCIAYYSTEALAKNAYLKINPEKLGNIFIEEVEVDKVEDENTYVHA